MFKGQRFQTGVLTTNSLTEQAVSDYALHDLDIC